MTAQTIIAYAWNESDEGGWLVPTHREGTARLDAVRDALRDKQNEPNQMPCRPERPPTPGTETMEVKRP